MWLRTDLAGVDQGLTHPEQAERVRQAADLEVGDGWCACVFKLASAPAPNPHPQRDRNRNRNRNCNRKTQIDPTNQPTKETVRSAVRAVLSPNFSKTEAVAPSETPQNTRWNTGGVCSPLAPYKVWNNERGTRP